MPRRRLFRNPEFGHELGATSDEGSFRRGGSGDVVAASAGWCALHTTSIVVRAPPKTRSRTTPIVNVVRDSPTASSPNTTSQMGMIARWLNSIDTAVTFPSLLATGPPSDSDRSGSGVVVEG